MDTSILNSTKKILGLSTDDDSFDLDVITHINSAFSILSDLGVGPDGGFTIHDESEDWADLEIISEKALNLVKTCVYLRVRLLFDAPTSSYVQDAFARQIAEHEGRLSMMRESTAWVDPTA